MDLTRGKHDVRIEGHAVSVRCSDPDLPAWALLIDGREVDRGEAVTGDFTLRGTLDDGSEVEAFINRSVVGPPHVSVRHAGADFTGFRDFVA